MMKAKELILARLASAERPLPTHEFFIPGYSVNALATRASELAAIGEIIGEEGRGGVKYWRLATGPERLAFMPRPRKSKVRGRIQGDTIYCGDYEVALLVRVPRDKWRGAPALIEIK